MELRSLAGHDKLVEAMYRGAAAHVAHSKAGNGRRAAGPETSDMEGRCTLLLLTSVSRSGRPLRLPLWAQA